MQYFGQFNISSSQALCWQNLLDPVLRKLCKRVIKGGEIPCVVWSQMKYVQERHKEMKQHVPFLWGKMNCYSLCDRNLSGLLCENLWLWRITSLLGSIALYFTVFSVTKFSIWPDFKHIPSPFLHLKHILSCLLKQDVEIFRKIFINFKTLVFSHSFLSRLQNAQCIQSFHVSHVVLLGFQCSHTFLFLKSGSPNGIC